LWGSHAALTTGDDVGKHIQFRRATLVRSFAGTLIYAVAVIAAPVSPVAALAMVVFVPAIFNIPILLRHHRRV
jgi:hypothetical protein